jgi:hypothetical protein
MSTDPDWIRFMQCMMDIDDREISDAANHYADDIVDNTDAPENSGERKAECSIAFEAGRRWERARDYGLLATFAGFQAGFGPRSGS